MNTEIKTLTLAEELIIDYVLSKVLDEAYDGNDKEAHWSNPLLFLTDYEMETAKGLIQKVRK